MVRMIIYLLTVSGSRSLGFKQVTKCYLLGNTCRHPVARCTEPVVGWVTERCTRHHAAYSPVCFELYRPPAHGCPSRQCLGRPRAPASRRYVAVCPGVVGMYRRRARLLSGPRYTNCTCQAINLSITHLSINRPVNHALVNHAPFNHAPVNQSTCQSRTCQSIDLSIMHLSINRPVNHALVNHAPVNHAPVNQSTCQSIDLSINRPVNHAPVNHALVNHAPVNQSTCHSHTCQSNTPDNHALVADTETDVNKSYTEYIVTLTTTQPRSFPVLQLRVQQV